jgi:hypothetical protein
MIVFVWVFTYSFAMRKALRVLPMLLSLALIAGMAQAATAPKAGTACKIVGQTITAGGKKYTCIKSGKKLVWNKGVAVPLPAPSATPTATPSPTSTPTPTKTPEPKPLMAGDPCSVVGDSVNNPQSYLECREVANNQKKYFQLSNSVSDLAAQASPLPFTTCRVPDQRTTKISPEAIAYPITWSPLNRTGNIKVLFIPFDFSDFPGSGNPTSIYSQDMVKFKEWVKWYSNGKRSVQVETTEKWIRASKPSTAYSDYLGHANEKNQLAFEMLLQDSENVFDYTGIDAVFLIFPTGLKTFPTESTRSARIMTNKGQLNIGIYATGQTLFNQRQELWFWLTHELLHAWGIAQHAPANPSTISISTGTPGPGQSLISWDAMTLDWANAEDLWCTDLNKLTTSEVTLAPMEREQEGVRAAMVNLSPSRTLVIESHRKDKWGKYSAGTYGVTAYIVDTRYNTDRTGENNGTDDFKGTKYTRAANYIEFNVNHGAYKMQWYSTEGQDYGIVPLFSLNYFLYEGESFTFEGVTVKLVKSGDNDTIQISKN